MFNWLLPLVNSLVITESLIDFQNEDDRTKFKKTIELWRNADNSRKEPRTYLRLFGEGLAEFCSLPKYIKEFEKSYGKYAVNAIMEAMTVANMNKIQVQFDTTGPVFQ